MKKWERIFWDLGMWAFALACLYFFILKPLLRLL